MPRVVYAECHYAECHYGECHYAEWRGAHLFASLRGARIASLMTIQKMRKKFLNLIIFNIIV
jgi:hypothetical protein